MTFLCWTAGAFLAEERKCTVDYIEFLERYAPAGHNFLYHSMCGPVTEVMRRTNFHVVMLTYSALSLRYLRPRDRYRRIRDACSFVGDLDAVKLAFPQDDYHNTTELDQLFEGLNVDIVYSVVPKHMNMFYPRSGKKAQLKGVLTGYVDDHSVKSMAKFNRRFEDRTVDLFQRVRMYTSYGGFCGRYAGLKGRMANTFKELGELRGFSVDISTNAKDVVVGDDWLKKLGNSRFSIGCEGGVSVWDPEGKYQDLVHEYVKKHGDVPFDELEEACFPGQDGRYVFSVVSPRLFESATMGCSQILVESEYLGLWEPWEHYIPVRSDLRDVNDALAAMEDVDAAKRRIAACHETLVENPSFRYSSLAAEVMGDIDRLATGRGFRETGSRKFQQIKADHFAELKSLQGWAEGQPSAHFPIMEV